MKKIKNIIGVFILLTIFFVISSPALAQYGLAETAKDTGLEKGNLVSIIATIINVILSLIGIAFFGLLIYAGILYLTAQGEEAPVKRARQLIKDAVIGLIIVLSAYAISTFVMSRIVKPISSPSVPGSDVYQMLPSNP